MRGTQLIMRREVVIYLLFLRLITGLCVTEFYEASSRGKHHQAVAGPQFLICSGNWRTI